MSQSTEVFLNFLAESENTQSEFVTFEHDDARWVQISYQFEHNELSSVLINFSYPYRENPEQLLQKLPIPLPAEYAVVAWQANVYATLDGPALPHADMAELIDSLFVHLFKLPENYTVTGKLP